LPKRVYPLVKKALTAIRRQIDKLDRVIVDALKERAKLSLEIGRLKQESSERSFAPPREEEIIERVISELDGPLPPEAARSIYREILSASRLLQQPMTIAYVGPPLSLSHIASAQRFGSAARHVASGDIAEVFYEVQKKKVHFGVVPVEHSAEGAYNHTLDMLLDSDLLICSEVLLQVSYALVSRASSRKSVRQVYGTADALSQCAIWLQQHLGRVSVREVRSTESAVRACARSGDCAAVATKFAADQHGLRVLADRIEDNPFTRVRFFVIGDFECEPTGKDKTCLAFAIPNVPGSLVKCLSAFSDNGVNLTMIQSRPTSHGGADDIFFVDVRGHQDDAAMVEALVQLRKRTSFVKLLGSYPESR
jgi:chorismate mutase/prephenate dehydratase